MLWVLLTGGGWVGPVSLYANPVLEWDALMLDAIRKSDTAPTLGTRNLAVLHAGIFDAANSIDRRHQPYRFTLDPAGPASVAAAVLSAGRDLFSSLYPGFAARAQELFEVQRRLLADTAAVTNGLVLGRSAAYWTLEDRSDDGAATGVPYVPNAEPGQWRRTAPAYRPPLDPHWRYVRRFCADDPERFVVPPPPSLASDEYAQCLDQVRQWGALDSSRRTAYDTETAVFWSDFSYTATPPGHWHEIAHEITRRQQLTLVETARLFALLSLAQADAAILCWEGKYRYNWWRPQTAIQRAEEDGNPATTPDPLWRPWLQAPSFPEHPSGHSTFSGAAAAVLAEFLGTDTVEVVARSDALPGVVRHYHSLRACAEEVGWSRVLGGIHFAPAHREGIRSGEAIGRFVVRNWLLPLDTLPRVVLERFSDGQLAVRMHGPMAVAYTLQRTTDLRTWDWELPGMGRPGGEVVFLPNPGTLPSAFFRLVGAAAE